MFVIPYLDDYTLIGTTDVPWHGAPGAAAIDPAETEYLCQVVNRSFERQIGPADVLWSFAGIRALQDDGASQGLGRHPRLRARAGRRRRLARRCSR